jgi:hypothetical protein
MPSNSLVAISNRIFQRLEELCRIRAYRLANGQKFHDVDAPFPTLMFKVAIHCVMALCG